MLILLFMIESCGYPPEVNIAMEIGSLLFFSKTILNFCFSITKLIFQRVNQCEHAEVTQLLDISMTRNFPCDETRCVQESHSAQKPAALFVFYV